MRELRTQKKWVEDYEEAESLTSDVEVLLDWNSSLPYSTLVMPVSPATPKLSPGISQTTQQTTYELFTPSN